MNTVNTEDFWNKVYATRQINILNEDDSALSAALNYFGDVSNANLLNLGCGNGSSSLFFAKQGANVVSVDISEVAINALSQFCSENKINNITPSNAQPLKFLVLANLILSLAIISCIILNHLVPFPIFYEKAYSLMVKRFFKKIVQLAIC